MKITKGKLKQIILEELEAVEEAGMPPSPFPEYQEGRFDKLFEKGAPGDALAEAVANQLMLDEESDFQAMMQGIKNGLEGWYKGHQAARLPAGATPGAPMQEEK
tara:strand:- start:37 stop:348 length:312 start_codon:yes stop_codon:yes gene_type:complete